MDVVSMFLLVAMLGAHFPAIAQAQFGGIGQNCTATCPSQGATVTITGPAASAHACHALAAELNFNITTQLPSVTGRADPFDCSADFPYVIPCSPFVCSSCTPIAGGKPGDCFATITALLDGTIVQFFYAMAWAVPDNGVYGCGGYSIYIPPSNPTCLAIGSKCLDLFPKIVASKLGGPVCNGMPTTYSDSCGGVATQPFACVHGNHRGRERDHGRRLLRV